MAQLPDDLVNQLLENIEELAEPYAKAKALQESLKENRKITKNTLMKMAEVEGIKSHVQQEKFAYLHPQYKLAVNKWIQAIEDEVMAETRFKNAEREWESWRTICANERAVK